MKHLESHDRQPRSDAPPPLDYLGGATSPFDRPIDPRLMRISAGWKRFGRVRRTIYWLVMLPAVAVAVWYFYTVVQRLNALTGN